MKSSKISFIIHGIVNIMIPFPALIATSLWGLLLVGIFHLDSLDTPFWYALSMFPLLLPPVSCIAGIIRGSIHFKKEKTAEFCLVLSIIGIFIYLGMLALCAWLGSFA